MTKNTIISIVIIFIFIAGLVWWSKAVSVKEEESSAFELGGSHPARVGNVANGLVALETFYDFGKISMKNGNVSKVFEITNPTSQAIKVPKVSTSCMCTNAYILNPNGTKGGPFGMPGHGGAVRSANAVVKPGETLTIEVVYDPNAHGPAGVGKIERAVFVEDENRNVIELKFKVNVTP